jgi:ubiquitin-like modifier-activating enzyme ATG7
MENLLKFTQLKVNADLGFWSRLYDNKLNEYRSNKIRTDIHGEIKRYGEKTVIQLSSESFEDAVNGRTVHDRIIKGDIYVVNTTEDLKTAFDIQNKSIMENMWSSIKNGMALNDHQLLNKMSISVYVDLKNYRFIYWIAFPVFKISYDIKQHMRTSLKKVLPLEAERINIRDQIRTSWDILDSDTECFVYHNNNIEPLTNEHIDDYLTELILFVNDMGCNDNNPSWLVRNLLFTLAYHISKPLALSLICYRENEVGLIDDSPCFDLYLTPLLISELLYNNDNVPVYYNGFCQLSGKKGKPGLRDISSSMDINKLSESALNMNNKLMKWRVAPNLDLENIANQKCLLIGAGTLGCHVARNLMAWGITQITFVDCGTVSYSNPARQSLYFQDDIGKNKAETAAINLKKIYGNVEPKGINMKVPMPGYRTDNKTELQETLEKFVNIIMAHDVIFLLTDTRESRWLPTLLAKLYNKLCLTAAIGFDTFVAVRHGRMLGESGDDLGCYFCTDSLDISNTIINAPMDKRCTVTRPGVSGLAASIVSELMVSCIDNKNALTSLDDIPQQIRGNMSTFETRCYYTKQSECCIACSDKVLALFKNDSFDFINNVISYEGYLTDSLGLNIDEIDIDDIDDMESIDSDITANGEDDLLEKLKQLNDEENVLDESNMALDTYNKDNTQLQKTINTGLINNQSPLLCTIDTTINQSVNTTLTDRLKEITDITLAKIGDYATETKKDNDENIDGDFTKMNPEDIEKSVNEMIETVERELMTEGILPNGFSSNEFSSNEYKTDENCMDTINENTTMDDADETETIDVTLNEVEKELLLPIMNDDYVAHSNKFIGKELAKKIYDSYSKYEQTRLEYIYINDGNGYDDY